MKRYSYEEFYSDTLKLARQLEDKKFDAIVFAARGGSFLAAALAYKLNIRTMYAINCTGYSGTQKNSCTVLSKMPNIDENHKNLLFIDEIVDSGETLELILNAFKQDFKNHSVYSVALFQRPTSKISADMFLHNSDKWIEFFWEDFEK